MNNQKQQFIIIEQILILIFPVSLGLIGSLFGLIGVTIGGVIDEGIAGLIIAY